MTTSPPEIGSDCGRRPARRAQRAPSERNLQVYEAVGLRGQGQAAVAGQFGLSQQRVSQICRQVDEWRAAATPTDRSAEDRHAHRAPIAAAAARAAAGVDDRRVRAPRLPMVVERRGERSGQTWRETITRDSPRSGPWIRLAVRISGLLLQLDLEPQSQPADDQAWLAKIAAQAASLTSRMAELKAAPAPLTPGDKTRCTSSKELADQAQPGSEPAPAGDDATPTPPRLAASRRCGEPCPRRCWRGGKNFCREKSDHPRPAPTRQDGRAGTLRLDRLNQNQHADRPLRIDGGGSGGRAGRRQRFRCGTSAAGAAGQIPGEQRRPGWSPDLRLRRRDCRSQRAWRRQRASAAKPPAASRWRPSARSGRRQHVPTKLR